MGMVSTTINARALEAVSAASQAVGRAIVRPESADFHFPDETVLISLSFSGLPVKSVRLVRSSTEPDQVLTAESGSVVYVTGGLRLIDIARIHIDSDHDKAASASVTLDLAYLSRRFSSPSIPIEWPAQKGEREILELTSDRLDRRQELIAHLNAHRVYYSNLVHRFLDSGTIVAMLGEYTWQGKPLIDQVEPQALTVAGNYLVFRAPVDPVDPSGVAAKGKQKTWAELLEDRSIRMGKQSADERLVPLPTAGVFAEAVLGRSNSAEKLDITRFWQWNDSPIPLTPTEIAPVGTGTRATPEDLKPGQLGPPVLNIVNHPSLPAPAGLGAVLGAVSTPNMFRDMSGLAGTQGLVQAGMEQTLHAATDAGQLASANMRTQAQKSVAMAQVAADIVKSVMGGGGSGGSSVQGISANGAAINHGKSLDARAGAANASGASGGGPVSIGGGSAPGAGGSGAGGGRPAAAGGPDGARFMSNGGSHEQAAFDRAVWGPVGQSGVGAANHTVAAATGAAAGDVAIGVDEGTGAGTNGSGGGGGGSTTSAVALFPAMYRDVPKANAQLEQALTNARNAMAASDRALIDGLALTIIQLSDGGQPTSPHAVAGIDQDTVHYSGSLLKVAAMYAAFELKKSMNALADDIKPATAKDLFDAARHRFDPTLKSAVKAIVDAKLKDSQVVPMYDRMFAVGTGTPRVTFTPAFDAVLRGMITEGHNAQAQLAIHAVGFGYLNGALAAGGFGSTWLCGDYSGGPGEPKLNPSEENYTPVRVWSNNDQMVAQATTTFQMAWMIQLIVDGVLVDSASSTAMRDLMKGASWFDGITGAFPETWSRTAPIRIVRTKVGRGDLKEAGMEVFSEGSVVRHDARNAHFVAVWQNLKSRKPQPNPARLAAVATLIQKTISNFLTSP